MRRPVVILTLALLTLAVTHAPCGPGEVEAHAVLAAASPAEDCQELRPAAPGPAWQPVAAPPNSAVVEPGSPEARLRVGSARPSPCAVALLARPLRL